MHTVGSEQLWYPQVGEAKHQAQDSKMPESGNKQV